MQWDEGPIWGTATGPLSCKSGSEKDRNQDKTSVKDATSEKKKQN